MIGNFYLLNLKKKKKLEVCEPCILSKSKRKPHKNVIEPLTKRSVYVTKSELCRRHKKPVVNEKMNVEGGLLCSPGAEDREEGTLQVLAIERHKYAS